MDYYDSFAQTLENHHDTLVEQIYTEIETQGLLPEWPNIQKTYRAFTSNIVKTVTEGVRTGDPKPWRDLASSINRTNIEQGVDPTVFEKHSQLYAQKMSELIEREFAGDLKLKAAYLRRVASITMVGNVGAITGGIKPSSQV